MESHSKSEEAEEKLRTNWLELPQEVTVSILEKLDAFDILESVQRVCTHWESISKEPSLWRTIIFRYVDIPSLYLDKLFMESVDRSFGGLIELQLIDCDSDEYLDYVTQRCTKIRRLRLVSGFTSDDGLCEAAKKLPLLEELEISCCDMVTAKGLHKLGKGCPLLKSLKMNRFYICSDPFTLEDDDSEAISIAENMVELRHLQLLGNRLTNKGLKSILDSCSHLESIDLRQCSNLELEQFSLGKRCTESIKDFRGPSESFNYLDFDPIIWERVSETDSDDSYDSIDFRHIAL